MAKKGYDYDKLVEREYDLKQRAKNLEEIKKILDKLKIRFWLYEGGLLGIYREGNFIPWDFDLDILLYSEDLIEKRYILKNTLKKNGFKTSKAKRQHLNKKRPKLIATKNGEKVSFNGYFLNRKQKLRVRIPYRFPCRFFEPGTTINFKGVDYPCPNPIEEYLEMAYGDWRTPIRSGNPDEYRLGRDKKSKKLKEKYLKAKEEGIYKYDIKHKQGYKRIEGD